MIEAIATVACVLLLAAFVAMMAHADDIADFVADERLRREHRRHRAERRGGQ